MFIVLTITVKIRKSAYYSLFAYFIKFEKI
jgi:hypothetical protein